MKILFVKIPDEFHNEISNFAKELDRNISQFVREAIREKMVRERSKPQPAKVNFYGIEDVDKEK
jgi:predicted transcriptional regulator